MKTSFEERLHQILPPLASPDVRDNRAAGGEIGFWLFDLKYWPILSIPPLGQMHLHDACAALRESNWMKRDVMIKRRLGFDAA